MWNTRWPSDLMVLTLTYLPARDIITVISNVSWRWSRLSHLHRLWTRFDSDDFLHVPLFSLHLFTPWLQHDKLMSVHIGIQDKSTQRLGPRPPSIPFLSWFPASLTTLKVHTRWKGNTTLESIGKFVNLTTLELWFYKEHETICGGSCAAVAACADRPDGD